jgi:hypothetical protein
MRKCFRKVYNHDMQGQGRTALLLTLVQPFAAPEDEYVLLGHCRGARETSGDKSHSASNGCPCGSSKREARSIFRAQAHVRWPRAAGISHSCILRRLHTTISRHHTASDKRGAKGIKHGKETRPRATVCSKTAVRVPTSHNREQKSPPRASISLPPSLSLSQPSRDICTPPPSGAPIERPSAAGRAARRAQKPSE